MNTPNIISNLLQFSFGLIPLFAIVAGPTLVTIFLYRYYFAKKIIPKITKDWIDEKAKLVNEKTNILNEKIRLELILPQNIFDPIELKKSIEDIEDTDEIRLKFKKFMTYTLFLSLRVRLKEIPIEEASYEILKDFNCEEFKSFGFFLNKNEIETVKEICRLKIESYHKPESLDSFRNEKKIGFLREIVGSLWDLNVKKMTELRNLKEEKRCIAEK